MREAINKVVNLGNLACRNRRMRTEGMHTEGIVDNPTIELNKQQRATLSLKKQVQDKANNAIIKLGQAAQQLLAIICSGTVMINRCIDTIGKFLLSEQQTASASATLACQTHQVVEQLTQSCTQSKQASQCSHR